jgi:MoxR-like ATPase
MDYRYYLGQGESLKERGEHLPPIETANELERPARYIAGKGLSDAVNVALMLGQPLLVTGEPGSGKTQLAWSIAYELLGNDPLVFHTKTTSEGRDLFYSYDALQHFRDANLKPSGSILPGDYITYEALGLAILLSLPNGERPKLPDDLSQIPPTRSVVLIDEIDKAPRDFPNDILYELDELEFKVKETGQVFRVNEHNRPVVVLTSNSEKNLPDPFLRRCIFYDIAFPTRDQLERIVTNRLHLSQEFQDQMLKGAIDHFELIRGLALRKKPATAELIAWIKVLDRMQIDINHLQPGQREALFLTFSIIAKNRDDLEIILRAFE